MADTGHKVRLNVNRKLIDWALTQSNSQCAIACAIKDADDDFVLPRVTQKTISFTDHKTDTRYTFPTPPKIAAWIDQFDRDRTTVKPMSIELDWSKAITRPIKHVTTKTRIEQAQRDRRRRERGVSARPAVSMTARPLRGEYGS